MPLITQNTIAKINDLDLVEVVKRYSPNPLKKTGSSYTSISPFTNEKTPSFHVVPSKNLYKCFSSGKGGTSPISFYMDVHGAEFFDAVKQLASDYQIEVEYENIDAEVEQKRKDDNSRFEKVLLASLRQYNRLFSEKDPEYVKGLGYDEYDATQWGFGLAPNLSKFLTKKAIDSASYNDAVELGLVTEKDGQGYDFFRNRWILPIYDHIGVLRGFAGRVLSGDSKYPKWINSKDSIRFNKSKLLFGLNHAVRHIQKSRVAYLVEGYTDVISMHKRDIRNVVASCGTSLTEDQVRLLKRFADSVVIIYDNDSGGRKNIIRAISLIVKGGLNVEVVLLPEGEDPDSFARSGEFCVFSDLATRLTVTPKGTFKEHIKGNAVDGVYFYIDHFLNQVDSIAQKQEALNQVAGLISKVNGAVIRDEYMKYMARSYDLRVQTIREAVDLAVESHSKARKRDEYTSHVKKNRVVRLDVSPNVFPFFEEQVTSKGEFKGIRVNKLKFVKLLASWGYSRFEISGNELSDGERSYTFVKIENSIITLCGKQPIIDHLERFIQQDYDFVGANCEHADAELLINKFYDGIRAYFNKDLFYRVRQENDIILNRDKKDVSYFYFQNGFAEISKDGYRLRPYQEMPGSVWNHQQLDRDFKPLDISEAMIEGTDGKVVDIDRKVAGVFAHFCWLISGSDFERFNSLLCIIGYLMHDFYDYKLKAINFTDSSLADEADGRSGKTLLSQMIGKIRSYTEINGKDFNPGDKGKYEDADIGTQVLHLNDVLSIGPNKFNFENVFNDITEGYMVKKLYLSPFRNRSKMIISSNAPIDVRGGSQRDRIMEYELSNYFSVDRSPEEEYGLWFGRDFDEDEWARFDNFMCVCSQSFLKYGLSDVKTINLEHRKLKQFTCPEFLEFMEEISVAVLRGREPYEGYNNRVKSAGGTVPMHVVTDFSDYRFDKKVLKLLFEYTYDDYQNQKWFTSKCWTKWLKYWSEFKLKVKDPVESRSNGRSYIQFISKKAV